MTFISLALSNFLCSKLGKKTAYVELNTTNQISFLRPHRNPNSFSYMGIDIYPCVTVTSLSEILSLNYDYFVLDMGVLNTYTLTEFLKCEQRFLVCSLCRWKAEKTTEKIEKLLYQANIHQVQVTVLDNLSARKTKSSISSAFSLPVITFPFISNPFQLKPEEFQAFSLLLERT